MCFTGLRAAIYLRVVLHNHRKILVFQKDMRMIEAMDADVIQRVREYLCTQPVLKAWVFGSFSRGEQTPTSDLDVIVVS